MKLYTVYCIVAFFSDDSTMRDDINAPTAPGCENLFPKKNANERPSMYNKKAKIIFPRGRV